LFSKNLDGIQTTSISGIGNETGRFYLGFQENFESCDQDDLGFQESEVTLPQSEAGFQESEVEIGMQRLDFRNSG